VDDQSANPGGEFHGAVSEAAVVQNGNIEAIDEVTCQENRKTEEPVHILSQVKEGPMLRRLLLTVNVLVMLCAKPNFAAEIRTNFIHFKSAPPWLTEAMVEKATGPVQDFLQWHLRRLQAFWHPDPDEFQALSGNAAFKALFRRSDGTLHLGPEISSSNFHTFFTHELVHAIFFQKYKSAIPQWLEEGLANYLAKMGPVDYAWLSRQPSIDVTKLAHPSTDATGVRFHYQTSTALTEMIVAQCSLSDLLQLSVGRKMETYLKTYCEIADLNASYAQWLKSKAVPGKKCKPPQKCPGSASAPRPKSPTGR
jgi:hypothetical protein